MHPEDCSCGHNGDALHKAYDEMVEKIEAFVKLRGEDDKLVLSDWFMITSAMSYEHRNTFYAHAGSNSAPHVTEGLLVIASRQLIDQEFML